MVFNSLTFLIFFAVVLALYYAPGRWRSKKLILLVASYLFYAAWNPPLVGLLWLSTVVDWFSAKGIHRAKNEWGRRGWVTLSLGTNLGLLAAFKYGDFFLNNFELLLNSIGIIYEAPAVDIILPVGISFYTFQTLSYTLDVYRDDMEPSDSLLDFALFVTFFPQLVAGPIVRARDFLPQLEQRRAATSAQFGWGLSLLTIGLFAKQVLADRIFAPISDKLFNAGADTAFTTLEAWSGTLAFSGQIFCDFAGYSTCAIGAALCMGFALPDNFRFPYASTGFSDFWRRWHISLSQWLRDYLYISLGGNRKGAVRTYLNLMATMLLGGLWHGAAWTFVIWGGLHGLFLVGERGVKNVLGDHPRWTKPFWVFIGGMITYALVCYAWVFFRASSFESAANIIVSMSGAHDGLFGGTLDRIDAVEAIGTSSLLVAGHWYLRNKSLEGVASRLSGWLRVLLLAGMIFLIVTLAGTPRAFIYFQF